VSRFSIHTMVICFLGVVALSGCGGSSQAVNTLRVGNGAEVQDLDPHVVTGMLEHRVLSSLFEGLTTIDPATLKAVPAAAASWDISEDARVYTFHLQPEGRWSDGSPVTAHDFVYAWRRILSPALAAEYGYMLHLLKNGQAYNEGSLSDFDEVGVKALDDYTLEVTLENPSPYFLTIHLHQAWYPVQQAAIEAHGAMTDRGTNWTRPGNLISNGPFVLTDWRHNEVLRVARSEVYWDREAVKLDGIEFHPIDNEQTEERSFRSGDIHITHSIPLYRIDVYKKENPEVLRIDPYSGVYFYRFNVTEKPFDDVRVRQAFSMALDRESIAEHVLKGDEPPAFFYTPPNTAGYTHRSSVSFNPEKARELLAEAGYPNGAGLPPVSILYNTLESHQIIAEAIQQMWRQHLNADVRLNNQDWKVYLSSMDNLNYQIARSAWIGDVVDPVNFLECFITGGGNNRTGWSNETFDQLIRQSYAEVDTEARYELLQQAEEILLEEAPISPIYFYTWKFLMAREVKGFVPNIQGFFDWKHLWLDS